MAYATVPQIKRWAKLLETMSDTEIRAHIPDIEQTINAKLSKFFVVPIASPAPVILQNASSQIIAGVVLCSRLSSSSPNKSELGESLKKDGWALIDQIVADPALMPDATRKSVTSADDPKDRVQFSLPRSAPIFGYRPWHTLSTPDDEPSTTRGQ